MTKGRSLRLFLADGTPGGIITAEIMNGTGPVRSTPRSRLADVIQWAQAGRTTGRITAHRAPSANEQNAHRATATTSQGDEA